MHLRGKINQNSIIDTIGLAGEYVTVQPAPVLLLDGIDDCSAFVFHLQLLQERMNEEDGRVKI